MNRIFTFLAFVVLFLVYAFFPTQNSVSDAYNYAAFVKYNDFIWDPHHLLYTPFLQIINNNSPLNALATGKVLNALFASLSLLVLYLCLNQVNENKKKSFLITLIVAFCFSTIRFATENETYILPIFFSMLASFFYSRYMIKKEGMVHLVFSSFFAIIAILFHQIQLFWWLGLFIGLLIFDKKVKSLFLFVVPTLIIPIAYFTVYKAIQFNGSLLEFVAHDYFTGSATSAITKYNFLFTPISFIRTFIQVHPNILLAIKQNLLFALAGIGAIVFFLFSIVNLFKGQLKIRKAKLNQSFAMIHLTIFCLQFAFAFFSVGNVEFMVMLPFLIAIICISFIHVSNRMLTNLLFTFLFWNGAFGLILPSSYDYKGYNSFFDQYEDYQSNSLFLTKDSDLKARHYFEQGNNGQIMLLQEIKTHEEFADVLSKYQHVYTNQIDQPKVLDRGAITLNGKGFKNLEAFDHQAVFQYEGLYGTYTVNKLKIK